MEHANGGLKGCALENFNTRVRTMANAHGGNLLMGQQIATLEYLRKAENGRVGDFAEITNSAIGTNFVTENGFTGTSPVHNLFGCRYKAIFVLHNFSNY